MGSDFFHSSYVIVYSYFNPRSPHGERHEEVVMATLTEPFQSTLPAWGATKNTIDRGIILNISIHAPRMGSDHQKWSTSPGTPYFNPRSPHGERHQKTGERRRIRYISIHAPRMGSDVADAMDGIKVHVFQSTLPAWGATFTMVTPVDMDLDFNPRSPHGERRVCINTVTATCDISIHAPRMGSDVP